MPGKIDLIYILGLEHVGSTLLDLILGSHSQIESVGEVHDYSHYVENHVTCSCSRPIHQCAYWQMIANRFAEQVRSAGLHQSDVLIYPIKHKTLSDKINAVLYSDVRLDKNQIDSYGRANYYLFKAILEVSGKSIILDSSKTIQRLVTLQRSNLFNIRVIYLYRHCGGWRFSIKKRSYHNMMYKSQVMWLIRNLMQLNGLVKHKFIDTVVLNYESFCIHPTDTINGLLSHFGLAAEDGLLNFRVKQHHNIAGNPMRFSTEQSISCDNKWISGLGYLDKSICKIANNVFLSKVDNIRHSSSHIKWLNSIE